MARKGLIRPLIPALLLFVSGILIEHYLITPLGLINQAIILSFFIIIIILVLGILSGKRDAWLYLMLFLFLGIFLKATSHPHSKLLELSGGLNELTMEGVIEQYPKKVKAKKLVPVRVNKVINDDRVQFLNEKLLLSIYQPPTSLLPGQTIRFRAKVRPFRNFKNPGGFNYELHMVTKGFICSSIVSDGRYIVPLRESKANIIERFRNELRELFINNLGQLNSKLARVLILGEKQIITPQIRDLFDRAGLGHVLAVSGLHMGLAGWFIFFVFRILLSGSTYLIQRIEIRKVCAFITCFGILIYALISGFQISTKRAMIMAFAYLFSIVIGRENETWSTFALAGIIILGLYPYALFSISFQFSFVAVLGILWLSPRIYKRITSKLRPDNKYLWILGRYFVGLFSATLSSLLLLLPLIIYYFNRISLISIPSNLCVIPLLGLWVIPSGIASSLAVPFSKALSLFFLKICSQGMDVMMNVVDFWSHLPFSSIWVFKPTIPEIFLYYVFLFSLMEIRHKKIKILIIGLLISTAIFDVHYWLNKTKNNKLLITFLDVGHGNSAIIRFPNSKTMIIDGGGFPGSEFDTGRMIIAPFLWYNRINNVDYMVLSHPQIDHMKGLIFIEEVFHPHEFWYNGERVENPLYIQLLDTLRKKHTKIFSLDELIEKKDISGVSITLIHPRPATGNQKLNNRSLVLKLTYMGKSILFTGDIEEPAERYILSNLKAENLRSDVLLVPHHGSITSSTEAFLNAINPDIAIISSSHKRGFPNPLVMKRLKRRDIRIFNTSEHGAITLEVGRMGIKVKTFSGISYETNG